MAGPGKDEGVGILIGLGPKPKPGEGATAGDDGAMGGGDEGKRMAAAAVRSALESGDDMALYDAIKGCLDYVLDEDDGMDEPMDEMAMEPAEEAV